jgi:hypothetical protein
MEVIDPTAREIEAESSEAYLADGGIVSGWSRVRLASSPGKLTPDSRTVQQMRAAP